MFISECNLLTSSSGIGLRTYDEKIAEGVDLRASLPLRKPCYSVVLSAYSIITAHRPRPPWPQGGDSTESWRRELLFGFAELGTAVPHSLFAFCTCSMGEEGMVSRLFVLPLSKHFICLSRRA
jgi:hypothetical protein